MLFGYRNFIKAIFYNADGTLPEDFSVEDCFKFKKFRFQRNELDGLNP